MVYVSASRNHHCYSVLLYVCHTHAFHIYTHSFVIQKQNIYNEMFDLHKLIYRNPPTNSNFLYIHINFTNKCVLANKGDAIFGAFVHGKV